MNELDRFNITDIGILNRDYAVKGAVWSRDGWGNISLSGEGWRIGYLGFEPETYAVIRADLLGGNNSTQGVIYSPPPEALVAWGCAQLGVSVPRTPQQGQIIDADLLREHVVYISDPTRSPNEPDGINFEATALALAQALGIEALEDRVERAEGILHRIRRAFSVEGLLTEADAATEKNDQLVEAKLDNQSRVPLRGQHEKLLMRPCPACLGSGWGSGPYANHACSTCDGSGELVNP